MVSSIDEIIGKPKVSGLIHLGAPGISRELHCWFMLGLLFEQMPTPYRGRCFRFRRSLFISRWVERKRIGGSDGFAKWVAAPAGQCARPVQGNAPGSSGPTAPCAGRVRSGPARQTRRDLALQDDKPARRSPGEVAAFNHPGLVKGGQAFQQGLHGYRTAALKLAGDLFGAGLAHVVQRGADGGDLFGQGSESWRLGGGHGGADLHYGRNAFGHGGMAGAVLVIGAQPVDIAAGRSRHHRPAGSAFARLRRRRVGSVRSFGGDEGGHEDGEGDA